MFKFHEGQTVALRTDNSAVGLVAGDIGLVWAVYETDPPTYDITFKIPGPDAFDMTVAETELVEADAAAPRKRAGSPQPRVEAA